MKTIRIIQEGKRRYLPLLLEADPCEAMIERYLDRGTLYVLEDGGRPLAAAVMVALDDGRCELKNIATDPAARGRGLASLLLARLFQDWRGHGEMLVGTTAPMLPFYRRFGFAESHVAAGFFVDNYPEPIYEDGVRCVDMLYLKRSLEP